MIKLFELDGKTVKITEHCHTVRWLKAIQNNWPDEALKVYAYIFYMSYIGEENPYFNMPEEVRQDTILADLELDFAIAEEDQVIEAVNKATKMYETPTVRAYKGISTMLDNLSDYMGSRAITDGKDGNITQMKGVAKDFKAIRDSFKGVAADLKEEQKFHVRGDKTLGYDQLT